MSEQQIDGKTRIEWGAIAVQVGGGPVQLASKLTREYEKISFQAVAKWQKNGVSPKWVLRLEREINGQVTKHQMAPVFYPPDERASQA